MFASFFFFFFFNDTATTEIYTRPYIFPYTTLFRSPEGRVHFAGEHTSPWSGWMRSEEHTSELQSHGLISYAVFCLKKKKTKTNTNNTILSSMQSKTLKKIKT